MLQVGRFIWVYTYIYQSFMSADFGDLKAKLSFCNLQVEHAGNGMKIKTAGPSDL